MTISILSRLAGTLFIAGGLASCIDVSMTLEITSETTGRATTEIAMAREFYDMSEGEADFCDEDGVLTITDVAATCVTTLEGTFEELLEGSDDDQPTPTITNVGPGLVRVTFPTASLVEDFGEEESDPETLEMMKQFFEGRTMTFTVSGGEIVKSNMEIASDGKSASLVIPLLDLLSNNVDLPDESFAVVDLN